MRPSTDTESTAGGDPEVRIVEVGPRDGLQNESRAWSTGEKLDLISRLIDCGFRAIEATAFVSPRWVPQMADHVAVMRGARRAPGVVLSALVPNEKGAVAALEAGAQELAVFTSASETFSRRNTNCSIAESLERFAPVLALASNCDVPVRGYVSCAVDCPFEGAVPPAAAAAVAGRLADLGCAEIVVADTIGRAAPERVGLMVGAAVTAVGAGILACHFHDTTGQALANVDVAWDQGIRVFDSAVGGLGGCPYAPGAAGNLASGALVRHFERRGLVTGIDCDALAGLEEAIVARSKLASDSIPLSTTGPSV